MILQKKSKRSYYYDEVGVYVGKKRIVVSDEEGDCLLESILSSDKVELSLTNTVLCTKKENEKNTYYGSILCNVEDRYVGMATKLWGTVDYALKDYFETCNITEGIKRITVIPDEDNPIHIYATVEFKKSDRRYVFEFFNSEGSYNLTEVYDMSHNTSDSILDFIDDYSREDLVVALESMLEFCSYMYEMTIPICGVELIEKPCFSDYSYCVGISRGTKTAVTVGDYYVEPFVLDKDCTDYVVRVFM